ncbi:S41 family peptidase [Flavobacterium psychrophilum]|uniref:S41 family peptidase n=4 Tax=Flavobacterium psychrophilum TaxID=96345 RepID=UPI0004E7D9A7|nr:S41 family peptidase [Flavobacterium psychrophilum]AIJ37897.1 Carboxy-terminal processing protease precursor [Flavobacterium psychrophilum]AKC19140.1 peptidase S41 [Flavobacterium psychrophilum]AKC23880.1 peptidase S41 [Flavobacterium psychrophilum]AKC28508.1 peptidase S41 [Flavobacterium psychrophilum]EKT3973828.1 peptidase S41 [Flavobacterium psychrophilum]
MKTKFIKKITCVIIIVQSIISCSSIKKYNAHLNDLISEQDLKSDAHFIYKKLQNLHPKLYWYINKETLDFKFDSLTATINKPMTSYDFYKKITPIICEVRQGHIFVIPLTKKYSKKETASMKKRGEGPLSQFDFEIFDGKLYVTKNKSNNKSISVGTQVVAIDEKNVSTLLDDYKNNFTSDGFNTTLKNNFLGQRFSSLYYLNNDIKDSLQYNFKIKNELKSIIIKRQIVDSTEIKKIKTVLTKEQKKAIAKKKDIFGFDTKSKKYMRNLKFIEKDSSIAVMKINGFREGDAEIFYKESFLKIKKFNTKTLIIDLRNNGGGRLNEIAKLYTYLTDKDFYFIEKSLVTKKTSLLYANYYKGGGIGTKIIKTIFAPFYYPIMYFSVHKNGTNYYNYTNSKIKKPDTNNFKGKLYVLINGGSFSASSIISSNLKGAKRALFVGEETGGAYNGTVAGRMPVLKMPHSKLNVRMGLMACVPIYKTQVEGRGIFPDKEIIPTLDDRINNTDPEMNWILQDINTNKFDLSKN